MQSIRLIRVVAGLVLMAISVSAVFAFGRWQSMLFSLSADGVIEPATWVLLRILLISFAAPGILLTFWETCGSLQATIQKYIDCLSKTAFLTATLALAGMVRILLVELMPMQPAGDYAVYHELGRLWATMGEYSDGRYHTGYFPPGWPFLLSRLILVFGINPLAGVLTNIALSLGIVLVAYRLSKRIWGESAGRWTAVILAFCPSQVMFSNLLCSEILFTFLFLFSLDLTLDQSPSIVKALAQSLFSGLILGAATLVRSVTAIYPLILIPLFFRRPITNKQPWLRWMMVLAGFALVVIPWIIRNHSQVGRTTISTNGGVNFYIGNNPHSVLGFRSPDLDLFHLRTADQIRGARGGPIHLVHGISRMRPTDQAYDDSLGYKLGWEYIRRKPAAFLKRGILNISYMMALDTDGPNVQPIQTTRKGHLNFIVWYTLAAQVYYFAILSCSILGIIWFVRSPGFRNRGAWLYLLTILYWLSVHFMFFGRARFHFPIVPLLAGFASLAICEITRRRPR